MADSRLFSDNVVCAFSELLLERFSIDTMLQDPPPPPTLHTSILLNFSVWVQVGNQTKWAFQEFRFTYSPYYNVRVRMKAVSAYLCSLVKEQRPWVEHLQVCQRGGWALFWVFPHLTTKERPCHVNSDLMPLKQIIGQTITYNGTACGFEVESWWHTTVWMTPRHGEHGVACSV